MGVPGLFKWLTRRYPKIVSRCIEEATTIVDGVEVPIDTTQPNPNGVEFDNLYLDMNTILHLCTHPENKPSPKSEDEMMTAMFDYIDRVFSIVRPRRLLYLAIDGVGTEFMEMGTKCLNFYIHQRLNSHPGWKNIEVILSDATVPGEGERKIMDYIRAQKAGPSYDPNTRHCLCGADADLILLGLATHEPNFTVVREEHKPCFDKFCDLCEQRGHVTILCPGLPDKDSEKDNVLLEKPPESKAKFLFVDLHILRDQLARDLRPHSPQFEFNTERAVDDWLLLISLAGNDFLPNIPSVKIWENVIHDLFDVYRNTLNANKGYLTKNGGVDLKRLERILSELAKVENVVFERRLHFASDAKKGAREKAPAKTSSWNTSPNSARAKRAENTNLIEADNSYQNPQPPPGQYRA